MLKAVGMSNDAALFATIANGAVSVLMTFVGIWLLGRIGRRTMTMIGQFGCTACLVFIGTLSYLMPETVNGQPDILRSYMVLLGMLMFLSFQQGTYRREPGCCCQNFSPQGYAVFLWAARYLRCGSPIFLFLCCSRFCWRRLAYPARSLFSR